MITDIHVYTVRGVETNEDSVNLCNSIKVMDAIECMQITEDNGGLPVKYGAQANILQPVMKQGGIVDMDNSECVIFGSPKEENPQQIVVDIPFTLERELLTMLQVKASQKKLLILVSLNGSDT